MRAPVLRAALDGLVVDNFAGGGGASTGIEAAIGRPVDIAINHDAAAIAMHTANHPETRHYQEDVWAVDPREACAGRPVALAWFSPDCTHFSRAKGGKPREQKIRGLAWVVVKWAESVRPRTIIVENVEEFQTWGPLRDDGTPDPGRAGEEYRAWLAKLVDLGYDVQPRVLVAADYGTPTTRKRLFLVATRRDAGAAPAWPEATHGRGRAEAWRPAAEVIDWSLPCPSIFDRARPLADATLRRIALGVKRYVLESASPFIVPLTHHGAPRADGLREPLRTVTAAHRGELALCAPTLVQTGYGEREGQTPRALDIGQPLGTVVAGGAKHALVTAFLAKHYGGVVGQQVRLPLGTVTSQDHHSLVTAHLVSHYGQSVGRGVDEPVPAVTAGGQGHHGVVTSHLTKFYGTSVGADAREPLPTVTGGGQYLAEVRAFLVQYYGADGREQAQGVLAPLRTVTTKARFGLVTVAGVDYEIADIGMRMLQPHELFAAQGFPEDYDTRPLVNGKPITKTDQIRLCGNSVCPPLAEAIVRSNMKAA